MLFTLTLRRMGGNVASSCVSCGSVGSESALWALAGAGCWDDCLPGRPSAWPSLSPFCSRVAGYKVSENNHQAREPFLQALASLHLRRHLRRLLPTEDPVLHCLLLLPFRSLGWVEQSHSRPVQMLASACLRRGSRTLSLSPDN